jgi:peptidoglycan/LPS O-acetylase OafA/YrhL
MLAAVVGSVVAAALLLQCIEKKSQKLCTAGSPNIEMLNHNMAA